MAEVNAGRVMILPLGNYNSATPYKVLDLVTYDGNSWLCRQDCTGVTPSDSASQFWQKFGSSVSIATVNTAGIVRPDGATITILADGTISVPIATINSLGLCRPDGQTIAINENGTISAQVAGALASLTDVQITSATQGQILQYDVTAGKWKNVTKQWLTELEQMDDVDIDTSTLANGQTLVYNSVTNKWENGTISSYPKLNDISTVMANTQAGKVVDALVDKNVISGMSSNLETINSAASQNYSAGDIIYCTDGRWYTADVDITSGTTLVVGTNVTHTTQQVINTNLTQSLVDIELKYDSTTDKPMYRERGADTWLPFSGGLKRDTVNRIALNASATFNVSDADFICFDGSGYNTSNTNNCSIGIIIVNGATAKNFQWNFFQSQMVNAVSVSVSNGVVTITSSGGGSNGGVDGYLYYGKYN